MPGRSRKPVRELSVVFCMPSFCFTFQPRKIEEIKDFLLTARRKDAKCECRGCCLCCGGGGTWGALAQELFPAGAGLWGHVSSQRLRSSLAWKR